MTRGSATAATSSSLPSGRRVVTTTRASSGAVICVLLTASCQERMPSALAWTGGSPSRRVRGYGIDKEIVNACSRHISHAPLLSWHSCLGQNNAWFTSSASSPSPCRQNGIHAMTMYFDDVSRFSVPWNPPPPSSSSSSASSKSLDAKRQPRRDAEATTAAADADDKEALVQKILTGYNADSAARLSNRESKSSYRTYHA